MEIFASLDLFLGTPKSLVLLVYVAVLAYSEYSKTAKSSPSPVKSLRPASSLIHMVKSLRPTLY